MSGKSALFALALHPVSPEFVVYPRPSVIRVLPQISPKQSEVVELLLTEISGVGDVESVG